MNDDWLVPDWPAPSNVCAVITTRPGGVSVAEYASMNCGDHVGDIPQHVETNRQRLARYCALPDSRLAWLNQVHGTKVQTLEDGFSYQGAVEADASFTADTGMACVVMTADCLPVLFCNAQGTAVAAAHAGWRGLANGVLESTLAHFNDDDQVLVYLGPAISQAHFEVGKDVYECFVDSNAVHQEAFLATGQHGKYLADMYRLARQRLMVAGVDNVYGGGLCTYAEKQRFFSYRRAPVTGRMASVIFLNGSRQNTVKTPQQV